MRSKASWQLEAGGDLQGEWDPDQPAQAVSNLVGNAIQHSGGTPATATAGQEGDAVRFAFTMGGHRFRRMSCPPRSNRWPAVVARPMSTPLTDAVIALRDPPLP